MKFLFYRLDEDLRVDDSEVNRYPRRIAEIWKRVKSIKIDTAFTFEGITYFFSDKMFYKFINQKMALDVENPRVSSQKWMDCHYTEEELTSIHKEARVQSEEDLETSSATPTATSTTISVFTLLLIISSLSIF